MRYEDIVNTIAKQIAEVAEDYAPDKTVVVCPERIFVDDYLPIEEQFQTSMNMMPVGEDDPNQPPFHDKIFVVIKFGGGQKNMAISNSIITIQVLSENNDFMAARDILDGFTSEVNFKYVDVEDIDGNVLGGMVQAYFTPEVIASQEAVYTGFRALLSCRGFVRVPEPGYMFVTSIIVNSPDGEDWEIPFIDLRYNYTAQADPQAFAGYGGKTMALNRQTTEVITFSTYLQAGVDSEGQPYSNAAFSEYVLATRSEMNAKYRIRMKTNLVDADNQEFLIEDDYYVLSGISYAQELGDMSAWTLSFAKAKLTEE